MNKMAALTISLTLQSLHNFETKIIHIMHDITVKLREYYLTDYKELKVKCLTLPISYLGRDSAVIVVISVGQIGNFTSWYKGNCLDDWVPALESRKQFPKADDRSVTIG